MTRLAAVLLGLIPAFVLLYTLFSDVPGLDSFTSFVVYVLLRTGIVAALHAAFGVALGLTYPRLGWRWGLWLYVPTLFLLIIFLPIFLSNMAAGNVDFDRTQVLAETLLLFGFFAGSLIAACLGAYIGAWAQDRFSS